MLNSDLLWSRVCW